MKTHTSQFKNTIKEFGREIDSKITYTINNEEIELGSEELNSITPHYEGAILKSVMKQLDIDSNVEIPIGTILRYQFGVKVGNEYEYIDYGNYVVYSTEKQEDTYSYKITCYDKMLYAMKDYENSNITFPIAIKDYLEAICEKVGLEYEGSQFANSDKVIDNELYLDNEGRSLEYTFRDVLDEIAQVSGGTICINNEDKLEVRYIHDVGELQTLTDSSLTLETDDAIKLDSFELEGKTTQANTPSPDNPSELVSVGYENLFDKDNAIITNGFINAPSRVFTTDSNGRTLTIACEPNTQYTISKIISKRFRIGSSTTPLSNNSSFTNAVDAGEVNKYTFTTGSSDKYLSVFYFYNGIDTLTEQEIRNSIQITKGTQAHSYIPYGKYGIEVKTESENLRDKTIWNSGYLNNNNQVVSNSSWKYSDYIDISEGDYLYTEIGYGNAPKTVLYDNNKNPIQYLDIKPGTINLSSYNAHYIRLSVATMNFDNLILNQSKTYLYTLDNPLRSINETKDLLYIKNGMLYVERKIGSIILDGSENWTDLWVSSNGKYEYQCLDVLTNSKRQVGASNSVICKSNYYPATHYDGGTGSLWNYRSNNNYPYLIAITDNINTTPGKISIKNLDISTTASFKSWLSTHNTEVQYVLAEPYTEELGQVDMPSTYEGITYLDAPSTTNVSYISKFEEIDEEYLKDVNVNFGEKFGAVNTIVLSRGGDGDKIALSIPSDLADEDKVAIQITDNQIMNGNNRADFMQPILSQLYGLEYYINDFSSTGICYLDLCDRYRIKIGDNSYKCIMFNDEVDITQGLEELIYTDMQEENEQEYKYIGSTDRGITQANIIANKAEATIISFTQQLDATNNRLNSVEVKQTATDETINIISTNIDANGNITEVTTTTGFTFNADGMTISDSNTNFSALHRNDGTYYYDGDTITGQYTKDGSKQKDLELFGVYYYGKNDINDDPMFVAQLYTDENGEECMGHFYNRGDN